MNDDRPIKASEEYLKLLDEPKERIVTQQTGYLRKSEGKVLPCFSETKLRTHEIPACKPQPTKREIYERIKSENDTKYDRKNKQTREETTKTQETKKQKPKRIEHPPSCNKRLVDTEEEPAKPPGKKEPQTQVRINKGNLRGSSGMEPGGNPAEREKYLRLIKQMERERQQLMKEREEFESERVLLEFRKEIKHEPGIDVRTRSVKVKNSQLPQYNSKKIKLTINDSRSNTDAQNHSFSKRKSFKTDLIESKKLIDNISQRIIQIQQNRKAEYLSGRRSPIHKIQLHDLPSLSSFNINLFDRQINEEILIHTNNKYYKQFMNRERDFKVIGQAKEGKNNIVRYEDGSFTTESKKHRTVQFPNGYKLTMFQNSDVRQEMPGMVCYYSRGKEVNKVSFCPHFDVYYFYKERQVEVHYKPSGRKEIKYKNGVKRTLVEQS